MFLKFSNIIAVLLLLFGTTEHCFSFESIDQYFRSANENVGALECNLVIHPRDVSEETKEYIKKRDGYRCVICGSTVQLEVDHRRALMNGGDNSISNLATLCDSCHTEKTRMDNSVRRKRQKICRVTVVPNQTQKRPVFQLTA